MDLSFRSFVVCLFLAFAFICQANESFAATKCPAGQSPSYIIKGKCIKKTAAKAGLKQFATDTCTTCHGATSALCPNDLGTGSCSYKRMASTLKAAVGTKKSIPPAYLIDLFNAYSSYMPNIAPPTTSQAQKYIAYLSTLKQ